MPWLYQPDETPKRKHAWDQERAGFVEVDGVRVSKCPSNITLETAAELLNLGIPHLRRGQADVGWPDAIYVVHDGVVYRAKPTIAGVSYHAFPESPDRVRALPRALSRQILVRADELGCGDEVRRWLRG